jgi:hypothetical protein
MARMSAHHAEKTKIATTVGSGHDRQREAALF